MVILGVLECLDQVLDRKSVPDIVHLREAPPVWERLGHVLDKALNVVDVDGYVPRVLVHLHEVGNEGLSHLFPVACGERVTEALCNCFALHFDFVQDIFYNIVQDIVSNIVQNNFSHY